jgi:integrase
MGTVFLRGNSWSIEYRSNNGSIRRESVGKKGIITKTMAREILQKRERNVKLGKEDMLDSEIPNLEEFSKEYLTYVRDVTKKRSWKRDELCLRHLINFYGNRLLSTIKPQDIDEYKAARLNKVAPATVNRELEVLRYLFNLADRWDKFFGKNPVSRAGLLPLNNQKERILNVEEEKRLISACEPYLRNIIITALYTGMRKGEIISLKWDNVDFERNIITIALENNKSKRIKRIPISSFMRKMLLELKLKSLDNDFVFLSSTGTPYTRQDSLNRAFKLALKKAEIEGLRFHDFRHTAGTRMNEATGNIVAVSKILGHSSLQTTMRYAHPQDSLKEAVESLSGYFSEPVTDKSTDMAKN